MLLELEIGNVRESINHASHHCNPSTRRRSTTAPQRAPTKTCAGLSCPPEGGGNASSSAAAAAATAATALAHASPTGSIGVSVRVNAQTDVAARPTTPLVAPTPSAIKPSRNVGSILERVMASEQRGDLDLQAGQRH